MDSPRRTNEAADDDETPALLVGMYETRPGRVIFTEEDNCDGWIATDLAVDLVR